MLHSVGICIFVWALCYGLGWSVWDLLPLGPLHDFCVKSVADSPYQNRYAALVCGRRLEPGVFTDHLQRLGIIHIFVVSGAHLTFLTLILERLRRGLFLPRASITALLLFYCGLTGGAPPVFRAFLSRVVGSMSRRSKLFWLAADRSLLAGLLCLCLQPSWITSYSLMLSWTAALVLDFCTATRRLANWPQPLRISFWMYVALTPFLLPFGPPAAPSILMNTLITPVLCLFLFPLALLTLFLPSSVMPWLDWVWPALDNGLHLLAPLVKPHPPLPALSLVMLWIYILFLHLGIRSRIRQIQIEKNSTIDPRRKPSESFS